MNIGTYRWAKKYTDNKTIDSDDTSFFVRGKNLYNKATSVEGYYVNNTTGKLDSNASYYASDYIKVESDTEYTQNLSYYMAFYDEGKTYISGLTSLGALSRTFTTPSSCEYIRCSCQLSQTDTFQIEEGDLETSYEEYIEYIEQKKLSGGGMILPEEISALIGEEINIYFRNILKENPSLYDIDVAGSLGQQQSERWTATPASAGTTTISFHLNKNGEIINQASTDIIVKDSSVGTGITKTAIFIGDSTTNAGTYTGELVTLFGADAMSLTLQGTRGTTPNFHEGRGGWTAAMYTTIADYLEIINAFWNPTSSEFDFSYYMAEQGYAGTDYVGINLGINDTFSYVTDATIKAAIPDLLASYQIMIDSIHSYDANIKIGIMLTIPPSCSQDAFGENYNNDQTQWRYKRNNYIWVESLMAYFTGKESSNIYVVPTNVNLDTENNMQTTTVAINSRNSDTLERQSNGVHPADIGYYQIADVIYYWLKGFES